MPAEMVFDLPYKGLTERKIDAFFDERGIVELTDRIRMLNDYIGAVDDSQDFGDALGDMTLEKLYLITKDIVVGGAWNY